MTLPLNDWQFWVATSVFAFALLWLVRGVLPVPVLSRRATRRKRGERRATLTIAGKPVRKK